MLLYNSGINSKKSSLDSSGSLLVGSALYTESQKTILQSRYDSTSGKYISDQLGFNGDWNEIKTRATSFYSDMLDGIDSGTWDNFDSTNVPIPEVTGSNTIEPHPVNGVNDFIHAASIDVVFTNTDQEAKALAVFTAILGMANDDNLDASNGTSKVNSTWGTQIRYDFSYSSDGNPWFISCAKISKLIISYAEVQPYIRNNQFYLDNFERVEQWFLDWATWAAAVTNNRLGSPDTFGANWRSGDYSLGSTFIEHQPPSGNGLSVTQPGTHYNSSGTLFNRPPRLAAFGVNNRIADIAKLPFIYGIHFNHNDFREIGFDFFRAWLVGGVFADGTLAEWFRSYNSADAETVNQGMVYNFVTISAIVEMAHTWAVAVENGLPGVSNRGRFYDYTTSEGILDHLPTYSGDDTGGGPKGIYSVLINWSRYFRNSANGGYKGIRFGEGIVAYNGENRTMIEIPQAIANTYYRTTELEDFVQFNTSVGYDAKLAGGDTPPVGRPTLNNGAWGFDWSSGPWGSLFARTGSYAELGINIFS